MGNRLYLECNSGISGDMLVAALLDLGASTEGLSDVLSSVPVRGFDIKMSRVKKMGLDCMDFDVVLDKSYENHDHDMEYLYGHYSDHDFDHKHHHDHEHDHDHNHEHEHEHDHEHDHDHTHSHHHEHRGLGDVTDIINKTSLSDNAKSIAIRIFSIIAEAEAKAHGETIETVHFHEVGAIDSIVDVISIAFCIDNLDIDEVIVPYMCEGSGTVRCQHGILPIPVPAVANIVAQHGIDIRIVSQKGELITPTGAAAVAALATSKSLPEAFGIKSVGLGAGKRAYEIPSILRAMIIDCGDSHGDSIYRLETDIDDCSGEQLGYVMERLYESGAREVHFAPIYMKKNRPAYELVVICDEKLIEKLENVIFNETTTIGIRRCMMSRTVLRREAADVSTEYGIVRGKRCYLPDGEVRIYPEYDSIRELALDAKVPYERVIHAFNNIR